MPDHGTRDAGASDRGFTGEKEIDAAIGLFAGRFLLVALLPGDIHPEDRRVITYSFVEGVGEESQAPRDIMVRFADPPGWPRRLRGWLRWMWSGIGCRRLGFSTPSAGDCASYHVEAVAPYDTVFSGGMLILNPRSGPPVSVDDVSDTPTRTHFFWQPRGRLLEWAFLRVDLRLRSTGLVRSSWYSVGFILGTVVAAFVIAALGEQNLSSGRR